MPAADFFLPEVTGTDDRFVAPMRTNVKIEPYVDGQATFAAMELDAAKATASVFVADWMFGHGGDSRVTLRDSAKVATTLKARGITAKPKTWVELLGVLAEKGNVDVRVILSDFDAIQAPGNHEGAWRAHNELLAEATRVQKKVGSRRLHVITSLHPATITTVPAPSIDARLRPLLTAVCAGIARRKRANRQVALQRRPGIWPFIDVDPATFVPTVQAAPAWVMHPVSHHWKALIVDAKVAYCGGLDLGTTRADTPRHDNQFRRWHDVQVRVDGDVARDMARAFTGRWNLERVEYDTFVGAITAAHPTIGLTSQSPTVTLAAPPPATPGTSSVSAQLLRTSSEPGVFQVPDIVLDDIRRSYQNAIERAMNYVYIENQYLRDTRIGDWLVARANAKPELVVIIVVPVAPEEVGPGTVDPITEHGMALQHQILEQLATTLPGRVGMFSMVAKAKAGPLRTTDSPVPPPGYRSRQIYVHSKLMIVDDAFAIIGSANANKRSFDVDSEVCVGFHDTAAVTSFRLKLWGELLGSPTGMATWSPSSFLTQWNTIANANRAASSPAGRKGFVVPHDRARFPGVSHVWVQDAWAGLTEEDELQPV